MVHVGSAWLIMVGWLWLVGWLVDWLVDWLVEVIPVSIGGLFCEGGFSDLGDDSNRSIDERSYLLQVFLCKAQVGNCG